MRYKYYSTQRPITPGAYPKPKNNPVVSIHNFDKPTFFEEIGDTAWGYIEYEKPLVNSGVIGTTY